MSSRVKSDGHDDQYAFAGTTDKVAPLLPADPLTSSVSSLRLSTSTSAALNQDRGWRQLGSRSFIPIDACLN